MCEKNPGMQRLGRTYDAAQSGIRAVKATDDGQRLKVTVLCENIDFQSFKCGDTIENLVVPDSGILTGVICGIARKTDAAGETLNSFEFLPEYYSIEPV